jgi:hypothetical protein
VSAALFFCHPRTWQHRLRSSDSALSDGKVDAVIGGGVAEFTATVPGGIIFVIALSTHQTKNRKIIQNH